jgi:N-acetylglucosamine malate deacetylase 2
VEAPASTFLTGSFPPERYLSRSVVIIAAHPDDEVLGVGTLLPHLRNLRAIVHVTDGAPRHGSDVAQAGVNSWQEYAALRRREFEAAMRNAGVNAEFICIGCADQEASHRLPWLTARLIREFQRLRPSIVFTHSYEGGHPDHDACAAAVSFACALIRLHHKCPDILEFASYHAASSGGFESEGFLGHSRRLWPRPLNEQQRQFKHDLLACYTSQQRVLCQFPLHEEPIRIAPKYYFSEPPHRGKLHYENFDWGITGRRWRQLARRAMRTLKLAQSL